MEINHLSAREKYIVMMAFSSLMGATNREFADKTIMNIVTEADNMYPQDEAICASCHPNGVMATDGTGPYDCYACGKKAGPASPR